MDYRAGIPEEDLNHVLAHTGEIWRELAGKRLFITGGTGFFGIWLLEAIAAANDSLKVGVGATVLSRDPARFLARMPHLAIRSEFDWLTGHPASFTFPDATRHDCILHLATATSAHLGQTDPVEMLQTKLSGIRHVLDYARRAGIRRLLVTSSGAVYGPQPAGLGQIPETYRGAPDPLDPASAYGTGKRLVEQMCALAPEVDCVIARCFSFIGPHLPLDARFAAGNFMRDALDGRAIVVRGDGRPIRSYLHAADLVIWLLTILVRGKARRAYNVGSDEAVSTLQLANRIARCSATPLAIEVRGMASESPPDRYVPDITCARMELGLKVAIGFDHAVARTYSALVECRQKAA